MARHYRKLMMTPNVLRAQTTAYGRAQAVAGSTAPDALGPDETAFIESRDSFYMATVSETGRPYIQHRGGAPGFLTAIDAHTLAFADLAGNRQLLTTGNLATNDAVALFLMDYPGQRRLKIAGRATILDASAIAAAGPAFAAVAAAPGTERVMVIRVEGHDWNCPQHITPRYTEAEVLEYTRPLREKIAALESELRRLRATE